MTIKIVALGGSLSQQSTSLAALRVALEGASQAGAEVELFDVRELELPMMRRTPRVFPMPRGRYANRSTPGNVMEQSALSRDDQRLVQEALRANSS